MTTRLTDQTDQMDSKMRTMRLETATKTEEWDSTSRELKAKLEEERQAAKSMERELKAEAEGHRKELEKAASAIEKADYALNQMEQTWHKVRGLA